MDLHRRAVVGLALVSGDAGHLSDVLLDRCERLWQAAPGGAAVRQTALPRRRRLTRERAEACADEAQTKKENGRRTSGPTNARAKGWRTSSEVVVAQKLQRGIQGPAARLARTITDTRVMGDLREATVFYTVYGDEERAAASAGLRAPRHPALRGRLGGGREVHATLTFVWTPSRNTARNIEDLLDKARQSDEKVRRRSERRAYAGEADGRTVSRTRPRTTPGRRDGRHQAMTGCHPTPDGLVIVDKPSGFTSHDVVAKMRHRPHPARRARRHARPDGDGRPGPRCGAGDQASGTSPSPRRRSSTIRPGQTHT